MTTFLRERGRLRAARMMLATVAASAGLVPFTVLLAQPQASAGLLAVEVLGATLTVTMGVVWGRRWPSRRQSKAAVIVGLACIAGWNLLEPNPGQAAQICMAAAITGGYIAFLHNNRLLTVNLIVALALDMVTTQRLAQETGVVTAAGSFWLIWFINLSVPIAVRGMSRTIRLYATRARVDPLTGLLNRTAFTETVSGTIAEPIHRDRTHLTVLMIDVDDFKRVNDTHGHAAGDRALAAVAQVLRHHTDGGSIVCRAGGEEFLIAVPASAAAAEPLAARLCAGISALPQQITASVGTASAPVASSVVANRNDFIEDLIAGADSAMYAAKRAGGNQAHHLVR